jgi:hypothetical protein
LFVLFVIYFVVVRSGVFVFAFRRFCVRRFREFVVIVVVVVCFFVAFMPVKDIWSMGWGCI